MSHFPLILSLNLPIALGYFFRRLKVFTPAEVITLRKFVVQVTVPFIIFHNIYTADISSISQLAPSATALFLLSGLYMGLVILLSRGLSDSFHLQNSFVFGTAFGNYGYLGWGVLMALYGEAGFSRAVFFTLLFWPIILLLGFYAIYLLTKRHATQQQTKGAPSPLGKLLLKNALPPVLTAALAFLLNAFKIPLPTLLSNLITSFANMTIPMILFTIGLSFRFTSVKTQRRIILVGSLVRVIPGILLGMITVLLLSLFFPMDTLTRKMILIQSVMPTATVSPFFCDYITTDPEVISGILTYSTLLALATLPLWYLLIENYLTFMY